MITAKKAGGRGNQRVVLLHGFGSDSQSWVGNMPALFDILDVWTLDLPGHGQSSRAEPSNSIQQIAEQLATTVFVDDEPVHLIGHSLGGALAMALSVRRPQQVQSLALIAPLGLGSLPESEFVSGFPELKTEEETYKALLTLVHKPQFISPVFAPLVLAQLDRKGVRPALRSVAETILNSGAELDDLVTSVSELNVARLVIWGAQDRISPLLAASRDSFKAMWQVFDQCGHLPHIEHRVATNKLLFEFLRSTTDSVPSPM